MTGPAGARERKRPRTPQPPAEDARLQCPAPRTPHSPPPRYETPEASCPKVTFSHLRGGTRQGRARFWGLGGELGDALGTGERLPGRAEPRGGLMQAGARSISPCLHISLALVEIWTRNAADH